GVITATTVTGTLGNSTSDTSLPMVGGVNTKLATKQDEIPAKNANTVLTYTGVAGTVGEKGIYQDTGTYASQTDSLIDAGTFNTALKNGLDNEFVCAGYATTGECWLWSIRNDAPNRSPNLFDSKSTRVMNLADTLALLQENKPVYCAANVYTGSTVGNVLGFSNPQNALAIPFTLGDTFYVKYFGSDTYTRRHKWCTTDANGIVIEQASRDYTMNSPITPTLPASYIFIQWANSMTPEQLSECMVIKDSAPITDFVPYGNVYIPQNQ
ncbi:MAG: hypothetical protein J5714_02970, partial [Alphaproteobacteria bacterium]|nr:hypothetical protein [Alphaproteobacteria bacterium]